LSLRGAADTVTTNGRAALKKVIWLALVAMAACWTVTGEAESYPDKPICLIVPLPPGGGTDLTAQSSLNR